MSTLFSQINKQTNSLFLNSGVATGVSTLDRDYQLGFLLESMVHFAIQKPNITPHSLAQKTPSAVVLVFRDINDNIAILTRLSQIIAKRTGIGTSNTFGFVNGWFGVRGFNLYIMAMEKHAFDKAHDFYEAINARTGDDTISLLAVDTPANYVTCTHYSHHRSLVRVMRERICTDHNGHYLFVHPYNQEAKLLRDECDSPEEFLSAVTGKGYHKGTRTLSQEMDIELNLVTEKRYVFLECGKCRSPHPLPPRTVITAPVDKFGLVEHAYPTETA